MGLTWIYPWVRKKDRKVPEEVSSLSAVSFPDSNSDLLYVELHYGSCTILVPVLKVEISEWKACSA
jgi:hypothetical protein